MHIRTEGNFNHESDEEETEDEQGKENSQTAEDDLIEVNCSAYDDPLIQILFWKFPFHLQ